MNKYFRTYFNADNTIIKNSTANYGKSPVAEIFYGGTEAFPTYSRYIFRFDETYIRELYGECALDLTKTKHVLKFKPTYSLEGCALPQYSLCLFPVGQEWSEGDGQECPDRCSTVGNTCAGSNNPSNWFQATPSTDWAQEGVFDALSGDSVYLQCQSIGGENCEFIEFDITDTVNAMITGDTANYGFGLALHANFELFPDATIKSVGIYTKDTGTFFEPFLETFCNDPMRDSRTNFLPLEENHLYLVIKKNGVGVALDELPTVAILSPQEELLLTVTGECAGPGIYRATVSLTGSTECGVYVDVWGNLSYQGKAIQDVEQEFTVQGSAYSFNEIQEPQYAFKMRGINRGEKIQSGGTKRVFVDVYEKYNTKNRPFVDVFYRIYKKEGNHQHTITDWLQMERLGCDVFFDLETFWMIKGQYFLDFKTSANGIQQYPQEVRFEVLNTACI